MREITVDQEYLDSCKTKYVINNRIDELSCYLASIQEDVTGQVVYSYSQIKDYLISLQSRTCVDFEKISLMDLMNKNIPKDKDKAYASIRNTFSTIAHYVNFEFFKITTRLF